MKLREYFRPNLPAVILDKQVVLKRDETGNETGKVDHQASATANFQSAKDKAFTAALLALPAHTAVTTLSAWANSPALQSILNSGGGAFHDNRVWLKRA